MSNQEIIDSYDELSEAAMSSLENLGYLPLYDGAEKNDEDFYYGIGLENQPKSSILPINDESMVYKKDNSYQLILEIYKTGVNDYKIKLNLEQSPNIDTPFTQEEKLTYEISEEIYQFNGYSPDDPKVQTIQFSSDKLRELNEKIRNESDKFKQENSKNDQYDEWRIFYGRSIDCYDKEDNLTLVIKDSIYQNHAGSSPITNYTCYHIDKLTHETITNTQFLKRNGYELDKLQSKINTLVKDELVIQQTTDLELLHHIYSTQISNDSCIFITDDGFHMMINISNLGYGQENHWFEIKEYLSVIETYETKEIIDEYPIINNSINDYYNWLTNFDIGKEASEHLHINLEGNFPDQINQFFDEYYKKIEEKNFVVQFIAGWEENFEIFYR